jgi:hypothetical protein
MSPIDAIIAALLVPVLMAIIGGLRKTPDRD